MGRPIIYRSNISKRVKKAKGVILKFAEEMESKLKEMYGKGGALENVPWDSPDPETGTSPAFLLALRQKLANEIKSGMLEAEGPRSRDSNPGNGSVV